MAGKLQHGNLPINCLSIKLSTFPPLPEINSTIVHGSANLPCQVTIVQRAVGCLPPLRAALAAGTALSERNSSELDTNPRSRFLSIPTSKFQVQAYSAHSTSHPTPVPRSSITVYSTSGNCPRNPSQKQAANVRQNTTPMKTSGISMYTSY